MSRLKIFRILAVMLGAGYAALAGTAQAATCGMTGTATGGVAVYDPFNGNQNAGVAHVTLSITRIDPPGANGGKTATVNFYLNSTNPQLNGTKIVPTSVSVAGNAVFVPNANIFYDTTSAGPNLGPPTDSTNPTAGNAFLRIDFTGNNAASNPAIVNFDVTLPTGLNISASQNFPFDATYRCTTTGGGAPTDQAGSLPNAVNFSITVLSALEAHYVGTALNFDEIGNISTSSLSSTAQKTSAGNYIAVQSSGAYSVTLASQNGFQLLKPGASVANDKINYSLRFLGDTVTGGSPNAVAISKSCVRAGIGSSVSLPIQAKLLEGGQGKNPSANYSDLLTVTVTPLIFSNTGTDPCATYGLGGF